MTACPETTVDCDQMPTCRELLIELQRSYMALIAGQVRVKVRFNDRWSEYHPASAPQLLKLINVIYDGCPDRDGLLDFRPARGRPMFLRIT